MNDLTFSERGRLAATHQGLDPIFEILEDSGFYPEILNTGGYCMALTVDAVGGTLVVTGWDTEPGHFMVGAYAGSGWENGDNPTRFVSDLPEAEVLNTIERFADALATAVL